MQTFGRAGCTIIATVVALAVSGASAQSQLVPVTEVAVVRDSVTSTAGREFVAVANMGLLERPISRSSGFRRSAKEFAPIAASSAVLRRVDKSVPAPWYAPLASLVVPGTGQALLKQQRSVAYLVAEGFLALRIVRSNRDRNDAKAQYQKLAAEVARAGFGTDKPAGPWDYYEILEHYPASGAYNMATNGPFTPETDESTYNGQQWLVARQIFWNNPEQAPPTSSSEYQRALDRYQKSAVQGSFRFSWREQINVQNEYILSIADANRSSQKVVSTLGLLAASHLASMVDAYITVRLRKFGGAGLVGASVQTQLRPTGAFGENSYGAAMTLSVPVGNGGRRR